jgi:hypothetical protein
VARKRVRWGRVVAAVLAGIVLSLSILACWTAFDNRRLPRHSRVVDQLDQQQKALLSEALHLHRALGDSIWPGWAREDLPVVLYNERYALLTGLPDPPAGWIKVPGGRVRGGPWEPVPDDSFEGAPYYRQALPSPGENPEAFTVRIGDRWAASLPTLEWFGISLAERLRSGMPPVLAAVFPTRMVLRLLIDGSDGYLCLIQHEAFHAHQGVAAPLRIASAERAVAEVERDYPFGQAASEQAWRRELGLLASCLRAPTREGADSLARRFLAARHDRRNRLGLAAVLVGCEREREWLEGLAKYVELESWRHAALTPGYRPFPALKSDPGFKAYAGFRRRYSREVGQIAWAKGDTRFYYSGMAQALILDRLMPGWKHRAFAQDVWLEDLVAEAVRGAVP